MEENDLVITKDKKGNIVSAGFLINNIMLQNDSPAMISPNNGINNPKQVSDLFNSLAIPAGLCSHNYPGTQAVYTINNSEIIDEDLYSKLIKLSNNKLNSRKNKKKNSQLKSRRRKG